jgi:hypothetical protein
LASAPLAQRGLSCIRVGNVKGAVECARRSGAFSFGGHGDAVAQIIIVVATVIAIDLISARNRKALI